MTLNFKPELGSFFKDETFRDDFTFRNSAAGIRRFPFPFDRDDYMYSVNMSRTGRGARGRCSRRPLMSMSITSAR